MRHTKYGVLLLLLVAGCAPKATIVDKWRVDPSSFGHGGAADMLAGVYDKVFRCEFKPDGTFTGLLHSGKYIVSGPNVTMTVNGPGDPAKNMLTGVLSADGKALTIHFQGGELKQFPQGVPLIHDTGG